MDTFLVLSLRASDKNRGRLYQAASYPRPSAGAQKKGSDQLPFFYYAF